MQNAYDAHSVTENCGKIKIVLVPGEGAYGTLYIANCGSPFKYKNLDSICHIGYSQKPPGENIGNKGLGFRSVTHISDSPEIYSLEGDGKKPENFGYCFRFAIDGDFSRWTNNPIVLKHLPKLLPIYSIPFPLSEIPVPVINLVQENFVSVIKMPLRNRFSLVSVCAQIEKLRDESAPLLLFLRRLVSLEVVVAGHPKRSYELTRNCRDIKSDIPTDASCTLTIVELNHKERYFIAWRYIPEDQVKAKVVESIKKKQLHPSWSNWEGDGELALAIRISKDLIRGRLYTFLPMGEAAESPFPGYLHGAFFPESSRKSLQSDSPLNTMYITESLKLCVLATQAVRALNEKKDYELTYEECGRIIVDLISWKNVASIASFNLPKSIEIFFTANVGSIANRNILPVLSNGEIQSWGSPQETWAWSNNDFTVMTSQSVSRFGNIPVLSETLGKERIERLEEFFKSLGKAVFIPKSDVIGVIAEKTAEELYQKKVDISVWAEFYKDLITLFKRYPGLLIQNALADKKILFCSDKKIRSGFTPPSPENGKSNKKKLKKGRPLQHIGTIVFSPPAKSIRSSADEQAMQQIYQVPDELAHGFAFLSQKLDWFGDLDEVRKYFENHKLVQKYDTRELIVNVSRIQRESKNKMTRRQALSWLYVLFTTRGEEVGDSLAAADIFVPVGKESWVSAKSAYFSKGWNQPSKINQLLDLFCESAAHYSQEISELKNKLLHPPNKKPFSTDKPSQWYAFLNRIGVRTGLHPRVFESKNVKSPKDISIGNLCSLLKLDSYTLEICEAEFAENKPRRTSGDFILGTNSQFLSWPGQGDFESFPPEVKKMNARLLLEWISVSSHLADDLKVEYYHHAYYVADRFSWKLSTPLLAFLRQGRWFPIENVRSEIKGTVFKSLTEVWLPEDWPRRFMPQICSDHDIRKTAALDVVRQRLRSWGSINILNDQNCLHDQVSFLGQLFKDGQIDEYYKREFVNLYSDTWKMLANIGESSWGGSKRPDWIITRNNGVFRPYELHYDSVKSSEETLRRVYVQDDGKSLVCTLLDELGQDVFDFETSNSCVLEILKELLGSAFVGTSSVPVSIVIDGDPANSIRNRHKPFVEQVPSFSALLCLAMECLTGVAAQRLPPDRGEMIARLREIRIIICNKINFDIAGKQTPLPQSNYGVFGHIDENVPCLIIEVENDQLAWSHLRVAGPALSRLLNQPDLASEIKNACSGMERLGAQISSVFDKTAHLDGLCRELNLGKIQAETALAIETGDKKRVELFLRPLVHYFGGSEVLSDYDRIREQSTTLDDLLHNTEPLFENGELPFQLIYEQVKDSYDYITIRKKLNLNFALFNKSIVEVEGEASAITYPEEHIIAMRVFLDEKRDQLVACLQPRYIDFFDRQEAVSEFVIFKDQLLALPPDNRWLLNYEEPPLEVINEMVSLWLEQNGFAQFKSIDSRLLPWSMVVKTNEKNLKKFISSYAKIISTWCEINGVSGNYYWESPESAINIIKSVLDKIGTLDFKELDDESLLKWMVKAGVWPDGMPASFDLEILGLTEEKLREKEKEASEKRDVQDKAHRSVKFGNMVIDPCETNYETLSEIMKTGLTKEFLKTTLAHFADIHKIDKKATGGGAGKSGGGTLLRLPQEKTELIGFLGECAVYHWLQDRFKTRNIESTWKSKNRERLCVGEGNDSLGYDFFLEYDRKKWFLEVKASLQNPLMFEMGETEVEKAKEVAVSGKGEYTIIYVSNIEEPARMKILVLPNPFSDEGKKVFGPPREKFRYSFGE